MGARKQRTSGASKNGGVKTDRTEKLKTSLQTQSSKSQKLTEEATLERLVQSIKERPAVANHILMVLDMGGFDEIDRPSHANQGDNLPKSCNKFMLLSKSHIHDLLTMCCPQIQEFLESLPSRSPKREALMCLCYLYHTAIDSALPTKSWAGLQKWVLERWQLFGRRLGKNEDAAEAEDESIQKWLTRVQASYFTLDGDKVKYICHDAAVTLPEELKALGVDKLQVSEGYDLYNAVVGCGCLKVKCCDLFGEGFKNLKLPWFKKEVPSSSETSTATTSPSPTTPATPTTVASTPLASPVGSGDAELSALGSFGES